MEKIATKPTKREVFEIFMQYSSESFTSHKGYEFDGITNCPATLFHVIGEGGITFLDGRGSGRRLDTISVNVKPLGRISKEDILEVSIIVRQYAGPTPQYSIEQVRNILTVTENDDEEYWEAFWTLIGRRDVADFLRTRGYAIPYRNWSVEELVNFGIFKLE